MQKHIARVALISLIVTLCGCEGLPPPERAELLQEGDYPNLAEVPARPATMPLAEREQLRRELGANNKAMDVPQPSQSKPSAE